MTSNRVVEEEGVGCLPQPALSLILGFNNFLAASFYIRTVFERALTKILNYFHLEAGGIYLLDQSDKSLKLAAHKGMDPKGLEKIELSGEFSGEAVRTRAFMARPVAELDSRKRSDFLLHDGFVFVICVPLITEGKVIGVMNLVSKQMKDPDEDEIDLLIAAAGQTAVSANQVKLYEDLQQNAAS
jgi:GAF domain-containing protein